MKILLSGINGFMGREVLRLSDEVVCGVDKNIEGAPVKTVSNFVEAEKEVDVIIDFSHHSATKDLLAFATENKIPLVLATTGQTEEELNLIKKASEEIPLFFAANYSLGIALLIELAKKTASVFPEAEIEIIEKHHNRKVDAPSGTALKIAESIKEVRENATFNCSRSGMGKRTKEEIGIHAVRMGNIVGDHEVIVGTESQTITLKHEAHSRSLFAEGALSAARFLIEKEAGLYDMKSMISF